MTKTSPSKHRTTLSPRNHARNEITLYGVNACLSAFKSRPQDLVRLFFHKNRARQVNTLKKWCADHKLPYRQLSDRDLEKVAGAVHHEGIVLVMRPSVLPTVYDLLEQEIPKDSLWVAFDRVGNTHNLGGLIRSAAYFGAYGCLLSREEGQATVSASTARMAEGALEQVSLYECADMATTLRDLQLKKVTVVGTDPAADCDLSDMKWKFPCVVVVGNEQSGLSSKVKNRCDALVRIPGAGSMQSLNVSVALGIVLAETFRHRPKSKSG